jgi:hypothetical protein
MNGTWSQGPRTHHKQEHNMKATKEGKLTCLGWISILRMSSVLSQS